MICRSLGYDARYVLDWTDHVWTEVYSKRAGRWLHCDACEAACDTPLMYETGWNKKLTYVIAFSKDEVQDVTWRYSAHHRQVLQRRVLVHEAWLLRQTNRLTQQLQSGLSRPRRDALVLRLAAELAEFLLPKTARAQETAGRSSGGHDWRRQRGELGADAAAIVATPHVWTPTPAELDSGEFCVEYSASLDRYVRRSDNDRPTEGWAGGVFEQRHVFRKVELDWKMAYLARTEGSTTGRLSWRFDLASGAPHLAILLVVVSCPGAAFEDGRLTWQLSTSDRRHTLPNGCVDHEVEMCGSRWCELSVDLDGGRGAQAWQHAQVGRQSTDDRLAFLWRLRVLFGDVD